MAQVTLPAYYRAADVFVTCSTSETYGLTVLEALACGTPVVLPHCGVFDELWDEHDGRAAWFYSSVPNSDATASGDATATRDAAASSDATVHSDAATSGDAAVSCDGSSKGARRTLVEALRCASARACKAELQRSPIKASWADAADGLLAQYQEAIAANLPYRQACHRHLAVAVHRALYGALHST